MLNKWFAPKDNDINKKKKQLFNNCEFFYFAPSFLNRLNLMCIYIHKLQRIKLNHRIGSHYSFVYRNNNNTYAVYSRQYVLFEVRK